MKKMVAIFLLIMGVVVFSASTYAIENNFSEAPEYISNIRQTYVDVALENSFSYVVGSDVEAEYHEENVISPTITIDAYTSYSFDIGYPGTNRFAMRIYFYMNTDDLTDKTFNLYFNEKDLTPQQIKEMILATTLATDANISIDDAQEKASQIALTYTGEGHGDLYINDEYTYFIANGGTDFSGNGVIKMYVIDNSRMQIKDDVKKEYIEMNYSELNAPLNALEKVCFTCRPITRIENTSESGFDILAEFWEVEVDNEIVILRVNFDYTPLTLLLDGRLYKVYGRILRDREQDIVTIRVDYIESLN